MNNKLGIFVLMLAVSIFPSRFYAGVDAGSTGSRRDYDENFNSGDRKSTRLNSSHARNTVVSRIPSSA